VLLKHFRLGIPQVQLAAAVVVLGVIQMIYKGVVEQVQE
jgi:hypothetical protein